MGFSGPRGFGPTADELRKEAEESTGIFIEIYRVVIQMKVPSRFLPKPPHHEAKNNQVEHFTQTMVVLS